MPNGSILSEIRSAARELRNSLSSPEWRDSVKAEMHMLRRAGTHALPWLLRARAHDDWSLMKVVLDHAREAPNDLALEMGDERLTWADLADESSRIARILSESGVRRGDVVALLGQNSPTYLAIVLGVARLGAVTALINLGCPLARVLGRRAAA